MPATTLQSQIVTRLRGDSILTDAGNLGFGVFDHWLVKPQNFDRPEAGTTPAAFDRDRGGRLKRSIVVLFGNENVHPSPSRPDWHLYDIFLRIYIFAEAHENGKQAIEDAKLRMERLLIPPWQAITTGNQRITLKPADDLELHDSDAWPGNVVAIVRYRATGARALVPV